MNIPKAICLTDDQLDFVVSCFDSRITQTEADRIKDMLLVTFDLFVESFESRYSAMARPPEPVFQLSLRLLNIS